MEEDTKGKKGSTNLSAYQDDNFNRGKSHDLEIQRRSLMSSFTKLTYGLLKPDGIFHGAFAPSIAQVKANWTDSRTEDLKHAEKGRYVWGRC